MNSDEKLRKLRHSLAHLLAAAIKELYPTALPTIGPATATGFYYDFDFGGGAPSEKDLARIEKKMKEILPSWNTFDGKEVEAEEARELYKDNPYKLELINEIAAKGEPITLYTSGSFTDLCRGGHVENTRLINPEGFELSHIAGAYWRGNEKNKMLTRIYGLSFDTKEELDAFKKMQEEAIKRDHRKIGKEMNLFTFSELIGSGLPLFTPKGTAMRQAIVDKINALQSEYGYSNVWIPHITKKELYMTSGHWEKFGEELFKVQGRETEFVMKPMNCPHHTQIYASEQRSYKDLPIRYAEATTVYRDEQGGELLGLSRVRSITQDDAHIFCTADQIEGEVKNIMKVIAQFYTALDMYKPGGFRVRLSLRDPAQPEKYLGGDDVWKSAESVLTNIAENANLDYESIPGDAAFYGPKFDFLFKDALGREWQLATIQLDFNMPARFGLEYTDRDGSKKTPVMIHRAIAGSLERFLSVIIEHFAGAFPYWLAPVQVKVLPIGESHREYAKKVYSTIKRGGLRAELDQSDESLGKKIRNAKTEKIPYLLVIGDKEVEADKVAVESRDQGSLGQQSIQDFLKLNK